jgi:hypothetical protein
MNTGIKFDSIRIARVDSGWRYKARVHEYLAPPSGPYVALFRPTPDIDVQFNVTITNMYTCGNKKSITIRILIFICLY